MLRCENNDSLSAMDNGWVLPDIKIYFSPVEGRMIHGPLYCVTKDIHKID